MKVGYHYTILVMDRDMIHQVMLKNLIRFSAHETF